MKMTKRNRVGDLVAMTEASTGGLRGDEGDQDEDDETFGDTIEDDKTKQPNLVREVVAQLDEGEENLFNKNRVREDFYPSSEEEEYDEETRAFYEAKALVTQKLGENCSAATQELYLALWSEVQNKTGIALEWNDPSLQELRDDGAQLTYSDSDGITPLHLAAQAGNLEIVRKLSDVDRLDRGTNHGWTPLHFAVAGGHAHVMLYLVLEARANLFNLTKQGQNCLHIAARYDQALMIVIILHLVKEVGSPFQVPSFKSSARHIRQLSGTIDAVSLAQMKTEESRKCSCRSGRQFKHCHGETSNDLRKLALNERRFGPSIIDSVKEILQKNVASHPGQFNTDQRVYRDFRDDIGRTPLHVAAVYDRSEAAKILMDTGTDPTLRDFRGETPLVAISLNMPKLAVEALKSLTAVNREKRVLQVYLKPLEPAPLSVHHKHARKEGNKMDAPRSFFEDIVSNERLQLIDLPVVRSLIDIKWRDFGRYHLIRRLLFHVLFIALWTLSALLHTDSRGSFEFKEAFADVFAVAALFVVIALEIWDIILAVKRQRSSVKLKMQRLRLEKEYAKDNERDVNYFEGQIQSVKHESLLNLYFKDRWNIVDWACLICLIFASWTLLGSVIGSTPSWDEWHVRFLGFGLIFGWLSILKYLRVFRSIGPFVAVMSHLGADTANFLLLFIIMWIPFSCFFFMVFGDSTTTTEFQNIGVSAAALFRMALADLEYEALMETDDVMTPILVISWLAVAGILFINLFIASFTNTYQLVSDNAASVASLERAETILDIQHCLSEEALTKHRKNIHAPIKHYIEEPYEVDDEGENDIQNLRLEILEEVAAQGKLIAKLASAVELLSTTIADQKNQGGRDTSLDE